MEETVRTLSRRKSTKLAVTGKLINVNDKEDTIEIIPVKLCYKKLANPIGSGRFGTVSAGQILNIWSKDGQAPIAIQTSQVAVKSVLIKTPKVNPKEVQILQKLSHQHIVQLIAYHKNDKELHLIFERMFMSLYDRLDQNGPFTPDDSLGLAIQLFRALDYLESEYIIHRDIKPTNILLSESCRHLKLCDFGCAKEIVNFNDKFSSYMCSRFYRAPELILGSESYDFKVDIWSAGCVIGEMFSARPLFQGTSSVGQLVEIVSILGPMTALDFEEMGLDESFALAEIVTKQNFSPRSSTFAERIRLSLGHPAMEDGLVYLFEKIFSYVPARRWDAEQALQYIQWSL